MQQKNLSSSRPCISDFCSILSHEVNREFVESWCQLGTFPYRSKLAIRNKSDDGGAALQLMGSCLVETIDVAANLDRWAQYFSDRYDAASSIPFGVTSANWGRVVIRIGDLLAVIDRSRYDRCKVVSMISNLLSQWQDTACMQLRGNIRQIARLSTMQIGMSISTQCRNSLVQNISYALIHHRNTTQSLLNDQSYSNALHNAVRSQYTIQQWGRPHTEASKIVSK